MEKLYFSGHETFPCRNYWLKKGLDHLWARNAFTSDDAVIHLGVGKNMVSSIRFWLKAFGLTDEQDKHNALAETLFRTRKGLDPFCEDIGTVWLLHYLLVTHKRASIYHLVFNEFRKQRVEFTRDHLQQFVERYCRVRDISFNSNSLKKDIGVFLNNYLIPTSSRKGIEDNFSGLLYELGLVHTVEKSDLDKKGKRREWYRIENSRRDTLPYQIILFCMLSNERYGTSITFNELLNDVDGVGSVFALSANGLMEKLESMIEAYPEQIVFSDDGGIRVVQFRSKPEPMDVLESYYAT